MAAGLSRILVFAAERSYDLAPTPGEGDGDAAGTSSPPLAKGHWLLQQVSLMAALMQAFLTAACNLCCCGGVI